MGFKNHRFVETLTHWCLCFRTKRSLFTYLAVKQWTDFYRTHISIIRSSLYFSYNKYKWFNANAKQNLNALVTFSSSSEKETKIIFGIIFFFLHLTKLKNIFLSLYNTQVNFIFGHMIIKAGVLLLFFLLIIKKNNKK